MGDTERSFIPLEIAVLTISDTRSEADDKSGKLLCDRLTSAGHSLYKKSIVPDDIYQISFSHASEHAPAEPGKQKIYVPFATPANALDCKVDVFIVS